MTDKTFKKYLRVVCAALFTFLAIVAIVEVAIRLF